LGPGPGGIWQSFEPGLDGAPESLDLGRHGASAAVLLELSQHRSCRLGIPRSIEVA
jgi:hypothetical protein